jgi:outer membrane lipoprotein SlyB
MKENAFKYFEENKAMKKIIATLMMMALMAVALPLATNAQTRGNRYYTKNRTNTSRVYKRPNFYQRNRNLINVGIGTGAGALIGGLTKGKKGALVGALIGAGGGALYTYVLNPKKKRYRR